MQGSPLPALILLLFQQVVPPEPVGHEADQLVLGVGAQCDHQGAGQAGGEQEFVPRQATQEHDADIQPEIYRNAKIE